MSEIKAKLDENTALLTAAGAPWEMQEQAIDGIPYRLYANAPKTVKELLDAGRQHGDKEFLIFQDERWSFNQFYKMADQISHQLVHQYHIKKGDRVAIAMRNYPEWMVAFVAISNIGAVAVPLNSWGQAEELEYGLTDAGVKVVFCDQRRFDHIAHRLPELGVPAIVAHPSDELPAAISKDMHSLAESAGDVELPVVDIDTEDTAMIMYTSGTTGNPKGAISTQQNVCQAIYHFELAGIAAAMTNPDAIGKMLEKGFDPKVLLALPLFHVSGCYSVFLLSLRGGRPIVMMYKWDVETALQLIEGENITMVSAVPTMLWELLESPQWSDYNTNSIFSFGAGGAAQPARLPELVSKKLPDSFPGTGYGMTESNAAGFSSTGAVYSDKPKAAGTIAPIVDIKICDEKGKELPQGEPGEIYLRSPTVVQGYWNKPEATAETFKDGWLVTGDVGYLDDDGYLFLTDRIKDMVIRGGENIYSAEIEAVIYQLEDIAEVAAFGVPHETLGEELAVVIRARANNSLTTETVQRHIGEHLANFKVPTHVFFSEKELPKNAARKILKKQIRQEYIAKLTK